MLTKNEDTQGKSKLNTSLGHNPVIKNANATIEAAKKQTGLFCSPSRGTSSQIKYSKDKPGDGAQHSEGFLVSEME